MIVSPAFLQTPNHRLAYRKQEGDGPTVMFLTGFKSDMSGAKAEALAVDCAARGRAFIRFDYSGHGASDGDFMDGTIGQWKQDALTVLDQLTQGPVVLVGSSMGAWIALLLAIERRERVAGLVGIASAPDFTERLIWDKLADQQRHELLEKGVFYAPSCYGEDPYPITRKLIEEGRGHLLLNTPPALREGLGEGRSITPSVAVETSPPLTPPAGGRGIHFPIHLLHGTADEDVPVEIAHELAALLPSATLTLIEGGNHRLSTPENLALICAAVAGIS